MKTYLLIGFLALISINTPAQKVTPCAKWNTDYISVEPKLTDGSAIDKYVLSKLEEDTSLKAFACCDLGLRIYSNCNGEFSYEWLPYDSTKVSAASCKVLRYKVETILAGIKHLTPGTIDHKNKDFLFKLIVRIKHNCKPATEILYYS